MTKRKPTLNVKLLRRIQKAILKEPKRIDMELWRIAPEQLPEERLPTCKTIGCIGGWAVALGKNTRGKNKLRDELYISDQAVQLLGLDPDHRVELFFPWAGWPRPWIIRLNGTRSGTPAYAKVVSDYIDYYISQYAEGDENA